MKLANPKLDEESLVKIILLPNFDFSGTISMDCLNIGVRLSLALNTLKDQT